MKRRSFDELLGGFEISSHKCEVDLKREYTKVSPDFLEAKTGANVHSGRCSHPYVKNPLGP